MKFKLILHVFTLLSLALVSSHAVSPQMYWKSVLPDTPMPKVIKDLLYTQAWDDGKEQVASNTYIKQKVQLEPSYSSVSSQDEVKDHPQDPVFAAWATSKDAVKDHPVRQQFLEDWQPFFEWDFEFYGASEDKVKGHPQDLVVASEDKVKVHPQWDEVKETIFTRLMFLENDLPKGKEMKMQFSNNVNKTQFMPKYISNLIPFSSKDLPKIYNIFSVKPDSLGAEFIKQALTDCERKAMEGEEKFCATSLESMVDFATITLGKNVKPLSTELSAKESNLPQKYKISNFKKLAANKVVVCHWVDYPYAVFYCHQIAATRSYVVYLEGANGTKVKALAVCHAETSKWNPKHWAFQLLKVTPGVPVCHFLLKDTVMWVPY